MANKAPKRTTYADLLAVPANLIAEILGGDLHTQPRPALAHVRATTRLGASLDGPFDRGVGGPGGWIILDEPEVHLGADVLVPDLAGWRRIRLPELPQQAWIELAPDWICEVLSPGTASVDRVRKMDIYARERVGHVWLIDPQPRTLEVYRQADGAGLRLGSRAGDGTVRAEPFAEAELDLGALWEGGSPPS